MTKNVNAINYTDMVQLSIEELEMVTGGLALAGKKGPRSGKAPIYWASSDDTNTGNQKYFK